MRRRTDTDREIAALATRQHGVITRRQLAAAGLHPSAIDRRVRCGRLIALYRGVYAVGHTALCAEGRMLAAVLACGPRAVLSHASSALVWRLRRSGARLIDVTVPTGAGRVRRRADLRVHRRADLGADEVTTRGGIPITTPARTILDLAADLDRRGVERAIDEAEVLGLFDPRAFCAVVEAHPNAQGARRLAAVLATHTAGSTLTRTDLEELFLGFCAAQGLQRPRVNHGIAGLEADFFWPEPLLVVEVDGYRFHRTRAKFERDRQRDALLAARGVRVLRFTDRQIKQRPSEVLDALRSAGAPAGGSS